MMNLFKKKNTIPPKKWSDITISDHKRIVEVYKKYAGNEDDPMFEYELVCAVYGKPWEWIEGMSISEAAEYVRSIQFLAERPKSNTPKAYYTLNGHRYKTTFNMQAITTAQYIDFQQMSAKSGEMPAEFLSIILIPEGKEYNQGYDLQDAVKEIEFNLSVEDALGLSAFFFNLLQISMKRSTQMLKRLKKKAEKEGKMTSEQLEALQRVIEITASGSGLRR